MADRPSNGTLRSFIDDSDPTQLVLSPEACNRLFQSSRGQITQCGAETYRPDRIVQENNSTLLVVAPRYNSSAPDQPSYVSLLLWQQLDDKEQ